MASFSFKFGFVALLFLGACTTDDDLNGGGSGSKKPVSMKVNGVLWEPNGLVFADLSVGMTLSAMNFNGSSLTLQLKDFMPGTYGFSVLQNEFLYINSLGIAYEQSESDSGSVTILNFTSSPNRIKGSFALKAVNPLNGSHVAISEGRFDLSYVN
jgi:hypothetical protein